VNIFLVARILFDRTIKLSEKLHPATIWKPNVEIFFEMKC